MERRSARRRWRTRSTWTLPSNRAIARRTRRKSVVLLANNGHPATGSRRVRRAGIAVVGPCADDARSFMGCYSYPNHVLIDYPEPGYGRRGAVALRQPASRNAGSSRITCTTGAPIRDRPHRDCAAAVAAAAAADLCIAVVGDLAGLFGAAPPVRVATSPTCACPACRANSWTRSSRPGHRSSSWSSPAAPTPLASMPAGPPRLCRHSCPAKKEAPPSPGCCPAESMPTGKLPVPGALGFPAANPAPTCTHPWAATAKASATSTPPPLYPFGHGLSYTIYQYSDLQLSATPVPTDGQLDISALIPTPGPSPAKRSSSSTCTTFRHRSPGPLHPTGRIQPGPPAPRTDRPRRLHPARRPNRVHRHRTQPRRRTRGHRGRGWQIGFDLPLLGRFALTGSTRELRQDRVLVTPVEVEFHTQP